MKMNIGLACGLITACALFTGCAQFQTVQEDIRKDHEGETIVRTRVTAWSFAAKDSRLTSFKAQQTEKTQAADVGLLDQATSTNNVELLRAIADLIRSAQGLPAQR